MPKLYLTPASISYLTQMILSAYLLVHFASQLGKQEKGKMQSGLMVTLFGLLSLFIGLMFLDVSLLPQERLPAVYLENTVLGLLLTVLIQFAYRVPRLYAERKLEARILLGASLAYTLYEGMYAFYRFTLLGQGTVDYRTAEADYVLAGLFAWAAVVLVRQTVRADERQVTWLVKLWKPEGRGAKAGRNFTLVYLLMMAMTGINMLRGHSFISTAIFNAIVSMGMLMVIPLFAWVHLTYLPMKGSFVARVVTITLTMVLMLLGITTWIIAPLRMTAYQPAIRDRESLQFSPNARGGYDVRPIPFQYENELGERLDVTSRGMGRNQGVAFSFPFGGETQTEIQVTSVGLLGMGESLYHPNLQYEYGGMAAIVPLLVDLEPAGGGGVYARVEDERLIVTWHELPAVHEPQAVYTFQVVLYADGHFVFNYQSLPDPLVFDADASPSATAWWRGVTPGRTGTFETVADLATPSSSGAGGILQDFYQDYREHLHQSIVVGAWLVIIGSAILSVLLPILLRPGLVKPLQALMAGVEQMNQGNLEIQLPVDSQDEVGILTEAFNKLVAYLRTLIKHLETGVAERTRALEEANRRLLIEMDERDAAQTELNQQHQALTALEERQKLSRSLHEGLGQALGYIHTEARAAETMLADGQVEAAGAGLKNILMAVQNAHLNLRGFILGLGLKAAPSGNLFVLLQDYLNEFNKPAGLRARMSLPTGVALPTLTPAVEEQLLHILQEALLNVRKHAQASKVDIHFSFNLRQVDILVSDDGQGFKPEEHFPERSGKTLISDGQPLGLRMMRERVEMIGGTLEIRSQPGEGTTVLISVPRMATGGFAPGERAPRSMHGMRILLVDDSPIFLEGLRNLLLARGLAVIGMARDGIEAQEKARLLRPDVIVMDVRMPRCDGLEATRMIKAEMPEVKIVMLTMMEDDEFLFEAIRSGASGYLLKSLETNEFCRLLTGLARGEAPLTPNLAARLLDEYARPGSRRIKVEGQQDVLTERQWQILELVAGGMTYKEIAKSLKLSVVTVKYHMRQILERLQVNKRSEAIAYLRRGRKKL